MCLCVAVVRIDSVGGWGACVSFGGLLADELEFETARAGEDAVALELLTAATDAGPLRAFALLGFGLGILGGGKCIDGLFGVRQRHLVFRGDGTGVWWGGGRLRSIGGCVEVAEHRAFLRRFGFRHCFWESGRKGRMGPTNRDVSDARQSRAKSSVGGNLRCWPCTTNNRWVQMKCRLQAGSSSVERPDW